jgi:ribosomal protein S18 acetylase RimI-like enzyme
MTIEYRNLLPQESNIYRTIRLESLEKFPASFGAQYQEALQIEKFRLESDIEQQAQGRFVIGAFDNQFLVGICVFVKEENNTGSIYQMYVRENYQGKHIGAGLIQATISEARQRFNKIDIFLEVIPHNVKAYGLYKKIGFEAVNNDIADVHANIMMRYGN